MHDFLPVVFGSLPVVLALAVMLALAVFWVYEFALLMRCREDQFPSPRDKMMWVAAFVFANVLGAVAYWWWKKMGNQTDSWVRDDPDRRDEPPIP